MVLDRRLTHQLLEDRHPLLGFGRRRVGQIEVHAVVGVIEALSLDDLPIGGGGTTTTAGGTGTGSGWIPLFVPPGGSPSTGADGAAGGQSEPPPGAEIVGFSCTGEASPQKWMNFYTKVLFQFATGRGLKLAVAVDVAPPGGSTVSEAEEMQVSLWKLALPEDVFVKKRGS